MIWIPAKTHNLFIDHLYNFFIVCRLKNNEMKKMSFAFGSLSLFVSLFVEMLNICSVSSFYMLYQQQTLYGKSMHTQCKTCSNDRRFHRIQIHNSFWELFDALIKVVCWKLDNCNVCVCGCVFFSLLLYIDDKDDGDNDNNKTALCFIFAICSLESTLEFDIVELWFYLHAISKLA